MRVLYILRDEPDETVSKLIEFHGKDHEVNVVRLGEDISYDELVDKIFQYDKVISW